MKNIYKITLESIIDESTKTFPNIKIRDFAAYIDKNTIKVLVFLIFDNTLILLNKNNYFDGDSMSIFDAEIMAYEEVIKYIGVNGINNILLRNINNILKNKNKIEDVWDSLLTLERSKIKTIEEQDNLKGI